MAKMRKLQVIDCGTGEIELEQKLTGGFSLQYVEQEDGHIRRFRGIPAAKFGDKHEIKNWYYQQIAENLIKRFDELSHLQGIPILYLENVHWTPPKNGANKWTWIARVKKANEWMENTWGYQYIVEVKQYYSSTMRFEQVVALLYHELRHIGEEGELLHHDVEDWNNLVATLGANWARTSAEIANILGDDFEGFEELRTAGAQLTLYDEQKSAAMAGGGQFGY